MADVVLVVDVDVDFYLISLLLLLYLLKFSFSKIESKITTAKKHIYLNEMIIIIKSRFYYLKEREIMTKEYSDVKR